jgi:hypothetical protein
MDSDIKQPEIIHTPIATPSLNLTNPGNVMQGLQGLVDGIQQYVEQNPFVAIMFGAGLLLMASQTLTNPKQVQGQKGQKDNR